MTVDRLLQLLSQGLYVVVFVVVVRQLLARPRRVLADTALFFGASMLLVALSWLEPELGGLQTARDTLTSSLLLALPYLLLRLVDDFADVPRWIAVVGTLGLPLVVIPLWLIPAPRPVALGLFQTLYFVALVLYAAVKFARESRRMRGVTRRRLEAAAIGSVGLGLVIFIAGAELVAPGLQPPLMTLSQVASLVSGLGYFLAFAPPRELRWAWQEPELRALLTEIGGLSRLPDLASIVAGLEEGIARSLGATAATIGLWDEWRGVLRYHMKRPPVIAESELQARLAQSPALGQHFREDRTFEMRPSDLIAGRAFDEDRAILITNAPRDDPTNALIYQAFGAVALLAAPIGTSEKRLGLVVAYAPREPVFAEDDLGLIQLLAEQAAIVIESRTLSEELARARAREEASRFKEDFLSAAAHDLRTPLTTLLAQAQLLELRILRDPDAPADLVGIRRLLGEVKRLNSLVREFLDSAPDEGGRLSGRQEEIDLAKLITEAAERYRTERYPVSVQSPGLVAVVGDRRRLVQVVDNLLENAVKYSPTGGEIRLAVWSQDGEANFTVSDSGIGIPSEDLPYVFQRFHRGTNVDDRQFAGLGLGLAIVRGIVEEHGGRIRIASTSPSGTTVAVCLPLARPIGRASQPA
jgi:signal transduction histidine kinase